MNNEKKFLIPEAIIVSFDEKDDIITTSGPEDEHGDAGNEWWN